MGVQRAHGAGLDALAAADANGFPEFFAVSGADHGTETAALTAQSMNGLHVAACIDAAVAGDAFIGIPGDTGRAVIDPFTAVFVGKSQFAVKVHELSNAL